MPKRNKSLSWAANQFKNRCLQDISYRYDLPWAKPTRIIFCVTLRCNIKCQQCAIWRLPKPPELTTEEWKKVISDLRDWIGPYRVQLAGGETFIREDILDIVRHATENDVLTGIVSNGTLITPDLASRIVDSGLGYLDISVDGRTPQTHDDIRGIQGLHAKTMAGIENVTAAARGSGMAINVATVVMRRNADEIVDLVKWVDDNERLDGIILNPLGPTVDSDPDWYKKTPLWFDDMQEVNGLIDQLVDLKRAGSKILNPPEQFEEMRKYFEHPESVLGGTCMVGVTNLSISCEGNIHTCFKMPPLGNVRDVTPREAWTSAKGKENKARIKSCDIHCSPGNFVYRRSLLAEVSRYLKYG